VAHLESGHSGQVVAKLTSDVNVLQGFFQNSSPQLLYNSVVFILAFGYLCTVNWQLVLISAASVPLTLYLINYLSKPMSKYARREQESMEVVSAVAQDAIAGIDIEKAYNLDELMQKRFNTAVDHGLQNSLKRQKRLSYISPLQSVVRWIPLLSCAVYGGYLTLNNRLTTGSLFAFIYLLQYLVDPINNLQTFISEFRGAAVSMDRIAGLLQQDQESTFGKTFKFDGNQTVIEFSKVNFSYTAETEVLKEVSFAIAKGKSVALVGGSGSGKSTVFKLLCGFYSPAAGDVKLYGQSFSAWDLAAARAQLALVSQETYLFPTSIAENIAFGKPGATFEEIVEAAKMANAHEFITQLPEGYHTFVGERGVKLSGGQKQRLTIARAILKDTPVLLLDEPTSALDVQSEALVQQALELFMKDRTVLMIAHRLSTIKNVDEILVMDQGRVVEKGTHAQLLEKDGVYRQLYLKQLVNETTERGA